MTFGVCAGCGAVAWELLEELSDYCMGCDASAYQPPDEDGDYDAGEDYEARESTSGVVS